MGQRCFIAGLGLALVMLTAACGGDLFGHHYRGDYIESFSVTPLELAPGGIAEIKVITGEDYPPWVTRLMLYIPPSVTASAGALYLTRAEAEAGQRDSERQYYSDSDPRHIAAAQAFFRAPETAQTVTLTATNGESKTLTVQVR